MRALLCLLVHGFLRTSLCRQGLLALFFYFDMLHIGKLIEEEMHRQERTPTWLAKKINCERPNVYYIFKQESINTDLLLKICRALKTDFFALYSNEVNSD